MKKLIITDKLNMKIKEKNLSQRKLATMIDYDDANFNSMILGKQAFSPNVIKQILPILEITQKEFESWVLADKYPKDVLKLAFEVKKNFPYKKKSILTTNIDLILEEKGMSRTALAKEINYSQSGLNRMIIGQISISKSVIERLSIALGISETQLKSWIVADKYSIEALEMALKSSCKEIL